MDEEKFFLSKALDLAKESFQKGGFPAGAVVVKDGEIIGEGIAIGNLLHDPTSHPETAAIRDACKKLKTTNLNGTTLYESVECCVMCFSVANWAGISRIVYTGKKTPELVTKGIYEGKTHNSTLNEDNNRQVEFVYIPEFEKESYALISEWEKSLSEIT